MFPQFATGAAVLANALMTAAAAFLILGPFAGKRPPGLPAAHDPPWTLWAVTIIALVFLTAPVAAHLVGRASYESNAPMSTRTWIDELKAYKERKQSDAEPCRTDEW